MTFESFTVPDEPGFRVVAGREHGLRDLMVVAGRLPAGDVGPVHTHDGDEVLHIVSGVLLVRCGGARRECGPGDVVVVPADDPHGFRVLEEVVLEVVAQYDIGTRYPVVDADGGRELVEVHRPDLPWGRPPPPGADWTTDAELAAILGRLAEDV